MNDVFHGSVADFALQNHIDYAVAGGLIKYLVSVGVAKDAGTRPTATGKGKPSNLYEFPMKVELAFSASG